MQALIIPMGATEKSSRRVSSVRSPPRWRHGWTVAKDRDIFYDLGIPTCGNKMKQKYSPRMGQKNMMFLDVSGGDAITWCLETGDSRIAETLPICPQGRQHPQGKGLTSHLHLHSIRREWYIVKANVTSPVYANRDSTLWLEYVHIPSI